MEFQAAALASSLRNMLVQSGDDPEQEAQVVGDAQQAHFTVKTPMGTFLIDVKAIGEAVEDGQGD